MKRFKTVDDYIDNNELWPHELRRVREILLSTGLTEEVKWGAPSTPWTAGTSSA